MNQETNNTEKQNNNQISPDRNAEPQKSSEISLPKIDRPEGPFEHSGETSRWTEEEKEEKEDESQQTENK